MNMKKHPKFAALALSVALLAGSALPARAVEFTGIYLAPKVVYGITKLDSIRQDGTQSHGWGSTDKSSWGGGLALGYNFALFNTPIRGEVEYLAFGHTKTTRSANYDSMQVNYRQRLGIQSLFFNFFWDIPTGTSFTPYLGAGLGMGFLDMKAQNQRVLDAGGVFEQSTGWKNSTRFAWNVGLGVAYAFNERFALDLGYRYADYGRAKSPHTSDGTYSLRGKSDVTMHQFLLSARISF